MCAGEGRDVIGVLSNHSRREDVASLLVEIDPGIAAIARDGAARAGLTRFQVIEGDAALSDVYARHVPADIVLACGIFGNISDTDIERTVRNISMLGEEGTAVIWTRNREEPDLTLRIRQWFDEGGFSEVSFEGLDNESKSGIGVVRLDGPPVRFAPGFRFFTFLR